MADPELLRSLTDRVANLTPALAEQDEEEARLKRELAKVQMDRDTNRKKPTEL